jgi:phospholipid-binding lipoprotein MlaA
MMLSKNHKAARFRGAALAAVAGFVLAGCATPQDPRDPFEKVNRATFAFNDAVDRAVLKPTATAYKEHTPSFLQTGVNNFFGNLADIWTGANNLLQGKGQEGMSDFTRVALNSTFGLLGVLDIASPAGLQKHNEDLGQTLGAWGVPSGPYLMLPLLGPSTVRDTSALPGDWWADPWQHKTPVNYRNVGIGTRAVDQRATILDASNLVEEAALDRYEFIRDGYLQRRESRVYDGDLSRSKKAGRRDDGDEAAPDTTTGKPDAGKQETDKQDAGKQDAGKQEADKPVSSETPLK